MSGITSRPGQRLSCHSLWFSSVPPDEFRYYTLNIVMTAFFIVHYSPSLFDATGIWSELLTASLNKLHMPRTKASYVHFAGMGQDKRVTNTFYGAKIFLIVVLQLKKFSEFYGTRRFITVFTTTRQWSLSWARRIKSVLSQPITLWCLLILRYILIYTWDFKVVPALQVTMYKFTFSPMRAKWLGHLIFFIWSS
jgi:hypothetical protein